MSPSGVSARRPPPWFAPIETAAAEAVPGPARREPGAGPPSRLRRALGRDPATPAVALVVAWAGPLVLLWAAALGAALGVLVATGVVTAGRTARLFHVAGAPGLRPWHLVDGLLSGAGGTVVAAGGAVFGSPLGVAGWLGLGLLLAAVALAVQWRLEAGILRTCGYRRPSAGELRRISAAAQRAGSPVTGPGTGEFLVVDSHIPMVRAFVDHVGI